ncbi:MAG: DUF805 domain-containing protein [Paracoccaceae bacterium]|nr:DUF805 domain-containing protein [Paracoccaceae bacterium]MDE2673750.1 DUF805 domain-containing protein [Paracoccaceae bacterium]MXZ49883.1 DUF805 domain-containing protein [Paracoccaceae bacterium]MYF45105.1 DUF805 domain-containing protein [Paracoccaceae bacterium]MYI92062.1 DUF805 domain-containing protein [Paracoccaceae bacterium]
MSFLKSIEVCFVNYFTFSGRASKREYWWFALFSFVLGAIGSETGLGLVFIIPSLAVGSRRLHDTGKSGWWQLIWLIPVIGWIILIILLIADSEDGSNKYGPPLNEDGEVADENGTSEDNNE